MQLQEYLWLLIIIDLLVVVYLKMRIIRLQIQHRTSSRSIEISKHAVSLDTKNHNKIKHFINHVKKICNLNQSQWQLTIDGFAISENDKSKILREHVVYRLRATYPKSKDIKRLKGKQIKPQSQSEQNIDSNDLSAEDSQLERQINIQEKKAKHLSKIRAKQCKINLKQKQSSSSLSSSSSDSDSSVSSDSSDSQSQEKDIVVKRVKEDNQKIKNQIQKRKAIQVAKTLEKDDKKQPIKKRQDMVKEIKVNSTKLVKPIINEDSSDSEQSEELPKIGEIKKRVPLEKQSIPLPQQNIVANAAKQTNLKFRSPQKSDGKLRLFKKEIIQDDSSSQSDDTPVKEIKKADKKQPKNSQKDAEKSFNSQQKQQKNIKPKNESKLPPALRNKLAKKSFEQHKKSQWLTVDKQKLKKWQEKGFITFSQPKNKIRFKIIQLDEQKFIPVKSEWISGQVKQVSPDGKVYLINAEQQGQKFRPEYELYEHNMDELQIYRLLAQKQQLQCLEDGVIQQNQTTQIKTVTESVPLPQNSQLDNSKEKQEKNFVQKFICGQVHFYFSDKNYFTDLYMQMHANRNPQKYLNISFLLNFPKIKKIIRDENKLLQYLREDQKYEQRNYQIDFVQKIIRKKTPKVQVAPNQQMIKQASVVVNESSGTGEVKLAAADQKLDQ